jgi:hypothetical protein
MPTFWANIFDEKVSRKETKSVTRNPLPTCLKVDIPEILDRGHSIEKKDFAFMAFGLVSIVDYRLGRIKIRKSNRISKTALLEETLCSILGFYS